MEKNYLHRWGKWKRSLYWKQNSIREILFGINTERAVKNFQRDFGLNPDGIVGPKTFEKLLPYINGYTTYKIKKGGKKSGE